MVLIIVFFFWWAIFSKSITIYNALKLSRPDVGSSSKIIDGSTISSTPMAVLLRSPPEITFFSVDPQRELRTSHNESSQSNSSTLWSYSFAGVLSLSLAAKMRASLTVKKLNRTSSYMTQEPTEPNDFWSRGTTSFSKILPESVAPFLMLARSLRQFKRLVLPAPDEPRMQVVWPGRANPEAFFTIWLNLNF